MTNPPKARPKRGRTTTGGGRSRKGLTAQALAYWREVGRVYAKERAVDDVYVAPEEIKHAKT